MASAVPSRKQQFLEAVRSGNAHEWTMAMGNEAGDLDSIASALAYSILASGDQKKTIALVQTTRKDLDLRAENLHAFKLAHIDPSDLLCLDELPTSSRPSRFVLVDHNRLSPKYDGEVVGVIDHHVDEKLYSSAKPRIIEPVGSCASLVAQHFRDSWQEIKPPSGIAILLICAILLDTGGLKSKGKTTDADRKAVDFLQSTLSGQSLVGEEVPTSISDIDSLASELDEAKTSVSHLSTVDLLRRDYKGYKFRSQSHGEVNVGLSTVPFSLKLWFERDADQLWKDADSYMVDQKLDVLAILNTFDTEKKGKHRRQIALIVKGNTKLKKELVAGLEAEKEKLDLSKLDDVEVHEVEGTKIKAWKQGNAHSTRKVIAPLFQAIIEI